MSKIGKTLTFIGISGAALAGLWYFISNTKKSDSCECECDGNCDCDEEEACEEADVKEREYVSLDPVSEEAKADKEALEKVVKSAVLDSIAKAAEEADGVGIVKDDSEASDFEFESFDEKTE